MNRTGTTNRTGNRSGGPNRAPRDHYQDVTDRIIEALEAGTAPWRRPWTLTKAGGPAMPLNATTGQRYRGINVLTLGMSTLAFTSGDPRWATYKQAEERGWQVRKANAARPASFSKSSSCATTGQTGRRMAKTQCAHSAVARVHSVPCHSDRRHSGFRSANDRGSAVARAGRLRKS